MNAPAGIRTRVICLEGKDSTTELPALIFSRMNVFLNVIEIGIDTFKMRFFFCI
tara:strand:- start:3423 stop:3584 length:162 start_codon:yes stop_codon:yes gene_type:complete